MLKKPFPSEIDPLEPDTARSARDLDEIALNLLTDIALAGNIPSSRLFSTFPATVAWEMQREAVREWENAHGSSLKD